jgi:hypothetical protein
VSEHQQVSVGEAGGAAAFAALRLTRLVDDGDPETADLGPRHLGQSRAQGTVIVVAVDGDQPPRPALELVEQGDIDPVAGVDDDVRRADRRPQGMR